MVNDLLTAEPWNRCFGCSPHNDRGLKLTFTQTGDGTVESRYQVPDHLVGPPGAVHGGIQAVLLDEVMGVTARVNSGAETARAVTAELRLRYRRPAPVGQTLVIRGKLLRTDGDNLFISGEILGPDREILTVAEGRFKALRRFDSGRV